MLDSRGGDAGAADLRRLRGSSGGHFATGESLYDPSRASSWADQQRQGAVTSGLWTALCTHDTGAAQTAYFTAGINDEADGFRRHHPNQ